MYRRWKKSVENGKCYPGTLEEIKAEQIRLDAQLAPLEARQIEIVNWGSSVQETRHAELYARLDLLQKLKCRYLQWQGHGRKFQLEAVVGEDRLRDGWDRPTDADGTEQFGDDYKSLSERIVGTDFAN
jgi:hypothetical protein